MDLTDIFPASCVASLLLLSQGCSGGGSSDEPTKNAEPVDSYNPGDNSSNTCSGSESQAVVSETNANDLAITAVSGVKQAVDESDIVLPSQPTARAPDSTATLAPLDVMDDETTAAICIHGGRATAEYIEADPGYINIFSDYSGCDGRFYRMTDVTVTEDRHSACAASGRIYDPNHDYIDVTTKIPFILGWQGGRPGMDRLRCKLSLSVVMSMS